MCQLSKWHIQSRRDAHAPLDSFHDLDSTRSPTQTHTLLDLIMTKQVMISLLNQGNTGEEILQILDNLSASQLSDASIMPVDPTLEELEF